MNPRLKLRLLKVSKVAVKVVSVGMVATGVATWGMQFLPPEVYADIVDIISTSQQTLTTYAVSSSAIGGGALLAMNALKVVSSSLSETDLKIQAVETQLKQQVNKELTIHADLDERVVETNNIIIANQSKLMKQNDIMIGFQALTAQRNIQLSDDLVPPAQKDLYTKWMGELKSIDFDVKPITKVIEVKEVIEKKVLSNGKVGGSW